jgi:hypothetical protein
MIECVFCQRKFKGDGQDPRPAWSNFSGKYKNPKCCDLCYETVVTPTRLFISQQVAVAKVNAAFHDRSSAAGGE